MPMGGIRLREESSRKRFDTAVLRGGTDPDINGKESKTTNRLVLFLGLRKKGKGNFKREGIFLTYDVQRYERLS